MTQHSGIHDKSSVQLADSDETAHDKAQSTHGSHRHRRQPHHQDGNIDNNRSHIAVSPLMHQLELLDAQSSNVSKETHAPNSQATK